MTRVGRDDTHESGTKAVNVSSRERDERVTLRGKSLNV